MNLRETKKLQVGDKFRQPSMNAHDKSGWREYRVISVEVGYLGLVAFTVCCQYGYELRWRLVDWKLGSLQAWMRTAKRL